MDTTLFDNEWFRYGLILILGIPLLVVLLNELGNSLGRRDKTLRAPIRLIRNAVVPLGAMVMVFIHLLDFDRDGIAVKLVETVIWILGINATLSIANSLIFSDREGSLIKAKVPQLFLDIFRVLLVGLGAAIVLSAVWGADLGQMVTALGLGSFVIGLALQDTLGNLFSGIALLYEKPFSEGDVIRVEDHVGEVVEMNWRAVRLLTRERELIVIPHLVIGQGTIENYSRPERAHVLKTNLGFAYHIPPNQVKTAIMKTCEATPGILSDPEPEVKTQEYADFQILYEVEFAIDGFMSHEEVMDDFMTRVWYTAQRSGLEIPFPQMHIHPHETPESVSSKRTRKLHTYLDDLPQLLPIEHDRVPDLRDGSDVQQFGTGEFVIKNGDETGTLYIIMRGRAQLMVLGEHGELETLNELLEGDFFGEITLFTDKVSSFAVRALTDLEVVTISPTEVMEMVEKNPKLALYLDKMMDARRSTIKR